MCAVSSSKGIRDRRAERGNRWDGVIIRGNGKERIKTEVCLVEEGRGKEEEELTLPVWEEDKRQEERVRKDPDVGKV